MKKPVNKPAENHYDLSQPEVKALWDAAYAKGVKDGTILSEERIIKLLEEKAAILENIDSGHGHGSELNSIRTKTIRSVIALIKGEK